MKKQEIIEMENCELINAFEKTVTDMAKATLLLSRGISPKLSKELNWIREEIITRMI